MSTVHQEPIYDELLELLADSADAERVLAFRLSPAKQERLDALLAKNREGTLTADEAAELDEFERIEHFVRMLKSRLLARRGP